MAVMDPMTFTFRSLRRSAAGLPAAETVHEVWVHIAVPYRTGSTRAWPRSPFRVRGITTWHSAPDVTCARVLALFRRARILVTKSIAQIFVHIAVSKVTVLETGVDLALFLASSLIVIPAFSSSIGAVAAFRWAEGVPKRWVDVTVLIRTILRRPRQLSTRLRPIQVVAQHIPGLALLAHAVVIALFPGLTVRNVFARNAARKLFPVPTVCPARFTLLARAAAKYVRRGVCRRVLVDRPRNFAVVPD